jgi:hypothetical protein
MPVIGGDFAPDTVSPVRRMPETGVRMYGPGQAQEAWPVLPAQLQPPRQEHYAVCATGVRNDNQEGTGCLQTIQEAHPGLGVAGHYAFAVRTGGCTAERRQKIGENSVLSRFIYKRGNKMYSIIGLLVLALDIFAILKIIQSPASGTEKILWILCVLLFPMVGMIIWFISGPGDKKI